MKKNEVEIEKMLTHLNVVELILSIYVLIAISVDTFLKLPPQVSKIISILDDTICMFFLCEFFIRFHNATDKWKFMQWGWIDLVASIPSIPFLRFGRALRIIRILNILRAFRSLSHLVGYIYEHKTKGIFTTMSVITILMMFFASISILQLETDPASNIKTAEDAIWWTFATVLNGFDENKFPVTTEGRILLALLIVTGKAFSVSLVIYIIPLFHKEKSADELIKLNTLRNEGGITENEYNDLKDFYLKHLS